MFHICVIKRGGACDCKGGNFCFGPYVEILSLRTLVKSPEDQRVTPRVNVAVSLPVHLLPACEWVSIRTEGSCCFSFLSAAIYAAFHSLVCYFGYVTGACVADVSSTKSLIYYFPRVVKKTQWFPRSNVCVAPSSCLFCVLEIPPL